MAPPRSPKEAIFTSGMVSKKTCFSISVSSFVHIAFAEAQAQAAADDDQLGIEKVDRRRDPGAQGLDRPLDQLGRHFVAVVDRPAPDARGEARFFRVSPSA